MNSIVKVLVELIVRAAFALGLVCLTVWLFSVQFGFEWSFVLCLCVWLSLGLMRWVLRGLIND